MFPGELVASVSDTFEKKFGLYALSEAKCIISPDTPQDIQDFLSAASFQSLASGEVMNMPIKNKRAKTSGVWTVPSIWASNMPGRWKDKAGAIQRRIWYISFSKLVTARDTTLKRRILEQELSTIFVRCILKYFSKIDEVGSNDVWNHAPDSVSETKSNLAVYTNPLEEFIENGSHIYQLIYKPGAQTLLSKLQQAYANFMEFGVHKRKGASIGSDYYPLTKRGFIVKQKSLCKVCGTTAVNKKTCGDHYDRRNRTRRTVIENLEIIRTREDTDSNDFVVGFEPVTHF